MGCNREHLPQPAQQPQDGCVEHKPAYRARCHGGQAHAEPERRGGDPDDP